MLRKTELIFFENQCKSVSFFFSWISLNILHFHLFFLFSVHLKRKNNHYFLFKRGGLFQTTNFVDIYMTLQACHFLQCNLPILYLQYLTIMYYSILCINSNMNFRKTLSYLRRFYILKLLSSTLKVLHVPLSSHSKVILNIQMLTKEILLCWCQCCTLNRNHHTPLTTPCSCFSSVKFYNVTKGKRWRKYLFYILEFFVDL